MASYYSDDYEVPQLAALVSPTFSVGRVALLEYVLQRKNGSGNKGEYT